MVKDSSQAGPELSELLGVLRDAPGGDDPCTAIESGLARLQGLLNLTHTGIYLFGEDFAGLHPALVWPRRPPHTEATAVPPLSWIVTRAGPADLVVIRSLDDLPRAAAAERAWFEQEGLQAAVLVPVRHDGALAGLLVLACPGADPMAWRDSARPELVRLGAWLGRFTPHLKPRHDHDPPAVLLRRLAEAAEAIGPCDDLLVLQRLATEQAVRALGAERCRLYLHDGDRYAGALSATAPTGSAERLTASLPDAICPPRAWFDALAAGGAGWTLVGYETDPARAGSTSGGWAAVTAVMSTGHAAPRALLVNDAPASGRPPHGTQQEMILRFAAMLGRAMVRCEDQRRDGHADATSRRNERLESMAGMAGVLAHDLNNLLMPVIGYSKLVADGLEESSEFRTEALEILRAAEEVSELATRLLAVGKRRMRQLGASDLGRLVAERRNVLTEVLGERIQLSVETTDGLPLIQADPETLLDILRSVLLNAHEALPDGGHVRIKAESCSLCETDCGVHVQVRPGKYVRISVEDDGPGMSPDVAARAFDPFFTTKKRRGAGLGLPTVYGAVRQCGGCVDLDSCLGRGTRIDIILPPADRNAGVTATVPARPPLEGTETVLVVEDEARVRRVVVHMLESLGYQVLDAASGPDALRVAGEHAGRIHLVLTDVVMPGMDGRETAEQLRRVRDDFHVLFMSGYADADLGGPTLDILRKPFTAEKLGTRIREVLDE